MIGKNPGCVCPTWPILLHTVYRKRGNRCNSSSSASSNINNAQKDADLSQLFNFEYIGSLPLVQLERSSLNSVSAQSKLQVFHEIAKLIFFFWVFTAL